MNRVSSSTMFFAYGDIFTATIFPANDEIDDFVSVKAEGDDADLSVFINDLESAVSLVKAASEAVEYFTELEARKAGVQDANG